MILISVGTNNHHNTWVVFVKGRVIGRRTVSTLGKDSTRELSDISIDSLTEAIKCLSLNLDTVTKDYTRDDYIVIETSTVALKNLIEKRKYFTSTDGLIDTCLDYFNLLPLPVVVRFKDKVTHTWASKYNKDGLETSTEQRVESALDWFSTLEDA